MYRRPAPLSHRLLDVLGRWLKLWLARARRRADREALRQMSDHQLRDLGIGRSEIEHVTSTRPDADTR